MEKTGKYTVYKSKIFNSLMMERWQKT